MHASIPQVQRACLSVYPLLPRVAHGGSLGSPLADEREHVALVIRQHETRVRTINLQPSSPVHLALDLAIDLALL